VVTDNRRHIWLRATVAIFVVIVAIVVVGITQSPDTAQIHFDRGQAAANIGDLDRALAKYTKGLRLDPKNADAYHIRAHMWKQKGDLDAAISDWTEAIRLDPSNVAASVNRDMARRKKREQEAEKKTKTPGGDSDRTKSKTD
jgi:tetratricopeptide (TPR) repeat protein